MPAKAIDRVKPAAVALGLVASLWAGRPAAADLVTTTSAGTTEQGSLNTGPNDAHWESGFDGESTVANAHASASVDANPFLQYDNVSFHLSATAVSSDGSPVGASAVATVQWRDFINIQLDAFSILAGGEYLFDHLIIAPKATVEGEIISAGDSNVLSLAFAHAGFGGTVEDSDLLGPEDQNDADRDWAVSNGDHDVTNATIGGAYIADPRGPHEHFIYRSPIEFDAQVSASGSATANLGNTITLYGIKVFDANGLLIPAQYVTLTSDSGVRYQPLGAAPAAAPEPSSLALLLLCGLGAGVTAYGKRRRLAA